MLRKIAILSSRFFGFIYPKVEVFLWKLLSKNKHAIIEYSHAFIGKIVSDFVKSSDNKIDDMALKKFNELCTPLILDFLHKIKVPNSEIVKHIPEIDVNGKKVKVEYNSKTNELGLNVGAMSGYWDSKNGDVKLGVSF